MNSTTLLGLVTAFESRISKLSGIPDDMFTTRMGVNLDAPVNRGAFLEYLFFLSTLGAVLSRTEVNAALNAAGFNRLTGSESRTFSEAIHTGRLQTGRPEVELRSVLPRPVDSPVYQLEKQIDELSTQVSELISSGGVGAESRFEKLQELVESMVSSKGELSAPISMPAPEDMAVKLVSSSSLDRLDEYHGDQTLFQTLFGVFAGAGLGLLIGIVTAPQPSITAWSGLTLGVFVTASAVFLVQALRIRGRASKVRAAALGGKARRAKRHDVAESELTDEHVPDEG